MNEFDNMHFCHPFKPYFFKKKRGFVTYTTNYFGPVCSDDALSDYRDCTVLLFSIILVSRFESRNARTYLNPTGIDAHLRHKPKVWPPQWDGECWFPVLSRITTKPPSPSPTPLVLDMNNGSRLIPDCFGSRHHSSCESNINPSSWDSPAYVSLDCSSFVDFSY